MKIANQYLNRGTQLGNSDGVDRSKHPDAHVMDKGTKPEAHAATEVSSQCRGSSRQSRRRRSLRLARRHEMNTDPNSPAVALPAKRRHRRISLTQAMQVLYDVLEDSRCDPKTKLRALEMAEKFCDWKPRSQEASGVDGDDVNEMVLAEERRQKREQGQMRNESLELRERIT